MSISNTHDLKIEGKHVAILYFYEIFAVDCLVYHNLHWNTRRTKSIDITVTIYELGEHEVLEPKFYSTFRITL